MTPFRSFSISAFIRARPRSCAVNKTPLSRSSATTAASAPANTGLRCDQRHNCTGGKTGPGHNWPVFQPALEVLSQIGGGLIARRGFALQAPGTDRFQVRVSLFD